MSSLLRDARFALRLLRRSPGFTALALLTIALGVGAATAIFSVVYGVFLAPLPYRDADALVMTWSRYRGERAPVSLRDYREWKARATVFTDLQARGVSEGTLTTGDLPEKSRAGLATAGFLTMLGDGHPLALGRTFREDEGAPGRDRVVVLTWRLWQERFGGDAGILGRTIHLNGRLPYVVIGVLGRGAADRNICEMWLPLDVTPGQPGGDAPWLNVMGRLRPGVGVEAAGAAMQAVAAETRRAQKEDPAGWSASVEPFRTSFMRDSTVQGLWLLLGAVGLLLLIACMNVANLLLARGSRRRHELALRMSLGATRGAVVGQLLVESTVLSFGGGALGVMLAWAMVGGVRAVLPADMLPSEVEIALSMTGMALGIAGAWGAGQSPASSLPAALPPSTPSSRSGTTETAGGHARPTAEHPAQLTC